MTASLNNTRLKGDKDTLGQTQNYAKPF